MKKLKIYKQIKKKLSTEVFSVQEKIVEGAGLKLNKRLTHGFKIQNFRSLNKYEKKEDIKK